MIRAGLLPGQTSFDVVIACVLIPLGAWLLVERKPQSRRHFELPTSVLVFIAAVIGCVGGIYGIGGGAILAPILIGSGRPPAEVAPATLASTFVTSVAGVATFLVLSTHHHGSIAPEWGVGIALGIGGLLGGYTGARLQPHLPESTIRRLLGVLELEIGHPVRTDRLRLNQGQRPMEAPIRIFGRRIVVRIVEVPRLAWLAEAENR